MSMDDARALPVPEWPSSGPKLLVAACWGGAVALACARAVSVPPDEGDGKKKEADGEQPDRWLLGTERTPSLKETGAEWYGGEDRFTVDDIPSNRASRGPGKAAAGAPVGATKKANAQDARVSFAPKLTLPEPEPEPEPELQQSPERGQGTPSPQHGRTASTDSELSSPILGPANFGANCTAPQMVSPLRSRSVSWGTTAFARYAPAPAALCSFSLGSREPHGGVLFCTGLARRLSSTSRKLSTA